MRPLHDSRRAASLMLLAAAAGCALRQAPAPPPADPRRSGAALAFVIVENATTHPLAIAFRPAAGPGGEVVVGRAQPAARVRLAPVPAGEPIVLLARTADGRTLELAAQTFAIDAEFVWNIPADAVFRRTPSDG